jgi:macrolide-specific efflux system membrane fusion protein
MSTTPSRFPAFLKQKKVWIGIIVLLIIGGVWWKRASAAQQAAPQYQTAQVEKGTLVVAVSSSGQISSTNSRAVTTKVSGVVKNVFVKNNQAVKTGAKLAEVELDQESQQAYTQASASYLSAKNSLASAQAAQYSLQAAMFGKWDTFKELAESDPYKDTTSANRALPEFHIPEDEWLAAESQYKNQQAVLMQAQTSLNSAAQSLRLLSPIITAPISGKVTGFSLMKGTVIGVSTTTSTSTAGQSIANIVTDALPTVTINLTEIDVTKVKIGDKATITLDAIPDKTFTGKVMSINTTGTVSSNVTSYPAVIAFDTDAAEVFSNMSAQANIITDTKPDVVLVPSSAIQTQGGQSFVRLMKNGKVEQQPVEIGASSGAQTEIISGVAEGDVVVTSSTLPTAARQTGTQTRSPFSGLGGGGFGGGGAARFAR